MRFGVMAMQVDLLLPQLGLGERPIGPVEILSRLAGFDHAALVRRLAQDGFHLVELGGDLGMLLPAAYTPAAVERLASLKAELGLDFTLHLPLWSIEPSTLQEAVRQGSLQALSQMIEITRPLQPQVYVLHATGALAAEFYRSSLPPAARALLLRQFQENARRSVGTLLERSGLPPRRLAVETIEFPFEMTLALAEEFDLSLCLDTGHVLAGFSGPLTIYEALEACLPRLGEVHLHDSPWQGPQRQIAYDRDHQPLGAGDLDVGRLLDRLQQAGFTGPVIFELQLDQALASLEVIRRLRPEVLISEL